MQEKPFIDKLHAFVAQKVTSSIARDPNTKYYYQLKNGNTNKPILVIEFEAGTGDQQDSNTLANEFIANTSNHPGVSGWKSLTNPSHAKPCYNSTGAKVAIYAEESEIMAISNLSFSFAPYLNASSQVYNKSHPNPTPAQAAPAPTSPSLAGQYGYIPKQAIHPDILAQEAMDIFKKHSAFTKVIQCQLEVTGPHEVSELNFIINQMTPYDPNEDQSITRPSRIKHKTGNKPKIGQAYNKRRSAGNCYALHGFTFKEVKELKKILKNHCSAVQNATPSDYQTLLFDQTEITELKTYLDWTNPIHKKFLDKILHEGKWDYQYYDETITVRNKSKDPYRQQKISGFMKKNAFTLKPIEPQYMENFGTSKDGYIAMLFDLDEAVVDPNYIYLSNARTNDGHYSNHRVLCRTKPVNLETIRQNNIQGVADRKKTPSISYMLHNEVLPRLKRGAPKATLAIDNNLYDCMMALRVMYKTKYRVKAKNDIPILIMMSGDSNNYDNTHGNFHRIYTHTERIKDIIDIFNNQNIPQYSTQQEYLDILFSPPDDESYAIEGDNRYQSGTKNCLLQEIINGSSHYIDYKLLLQIKTAVSQYQNSLSARQYHASNLQLKWPLPPGNKNTFITAYIEGNLDKLSQPATAVNFQNGGNFHQPGFFDHFLRSFKWSDLNLHNIDINDDEYHIPDNLISNQFLLEYFLNSKNTLHLKEWIDTINDFSFITPEHIVQLYQVNPQILVNSIDKICEGLSSAKINLIFCEMVKLDPDKIPDEAYFETWAHLFTIRHEEISEETIEALIEHLSKRIRFSIGKPTIIPDCIHENMIEFFEWNIDRSDNNELLTKTDKTIIKNLQLLKNVSGHSLLDSAFLLNKPALANLLVGLNFSASHALQKAIQDQNKILLNTIFSAFDNEDKLFDFLVSNNHLLVDSVKLLFKNLTDDEIDDLLTEDSYFIKLWNFYSKKINTIDPDFYLNCYHRKMLETLCFKNNNIKKYLIKNETAIIQQALSHSPINFNLISCIKKYKLMKSTTKNRDFNAKDPKNTTLHFAVEDNDIKLAQFILASQDENQKNIRRTNSNGNAPLGLALCENNYEMVEVLLTADISQSQSLKDDFSIYAKNFTNSTKKFIEYYHNKYVKSGKYKSILEAAYSQKHGRMFSFLSQINSNKQYINFENSDQYSLIDLIYENESTNKFDYLNFIMDNILNELSNAQKNRLMLHLMWDYHYFNPTKDNFSRIKKLYNSITNIKAYSGLNDITALHLLAENIKTKSVKQLFLNWIAKEPQAINYKVDMGLANKNASSGEQTVFSVLLQTDYSAAKNLFQKHACCAHLCQEDLNALLESAVTHIDYKFIQSILEKFTIDQKTAENIFKTALGFNPEKIQLCFTICNTRPELTPILLKELKNNNISLSTMGEDIIQLTTHSVDFNQEVADQLFAELLQAKSSALLTLINELEKSKESYNELFNKWLLMLVETMLTIGSPGTPITVKSDPYIMQLITRMVDIFANGTQGFSYTAAKNNNGVDTLHYLSVICFITPYPTSDYNNILALIIQLVKAGANPLSLNSHNRCAIDFVINLIKQNPSVKSGAIQLLSDVYLPECNKHKLNLAQAIEWIQALCSLNQFDQAFLLASYLENSYLSAGDTEIKQKFLTTLNHILDNYGTFPDANKAIAKPIIYKLLSIFNNTPLEIMNNIINHTFDEKKILSLIHFIKPENWDPESARLLLEYLIKNKHWNCVNNFLEKLYETNKTEISIQFNCLINQQQFEELVHYISQNKGKIDTLCRLIVYTTAEYSQYNTHGKSPAINDLLFKDPTVGINFLKRAILRGYYHFIEWLCVQGVDPLFACIDKEYGDSAHSALDIALTKKMDPIKYISQILRHAANHYERYAKKPDVITDLYTAGKLLAGQDTPPSTVPTKNSNTTPTAKIITPVLSLDLTAKRAFALGMIKANLDSRKNIEDVLEYMNNIENNIPDDIKPYLFERQGANFSFLGHRFGEKETSKTGANIYKLGKNRLLELVKNRFRNMETNSHVKFDTDLQEEVAEFLSSPRERNFLVNIFGTKSKQLFTMFAKGSNSKAYQKATIELEKEQNKSSKWIASYTSKA